MRASGVAVAISLAVVGLSFADDASAVIRRTTNIAAQELSSALRSLAKERKFHVLFRSDVVRNVRTTGAVGEFTTDEALRKLLGGTSLTYQYLDDKTITIVRRDDVHGSVQADTPPVGSGSSEKNATGAQDTKAQGTGAQGSSSAAQSAGDEPGKQQDIQEVVVTGTHIRGTNNVAAPLMRMTREDIAKTGYATLENLFDDLPQNFAEISADGALASDGGSPLAQSNSASRISGVDLRGLGAQSTLTLLNGTRRAGGLQGQVVDISAIPLSMIESVEVVTGGYSAIYGADAVAGVVNIETRRKFQGAETQLYYGLPTGHAGGERLQISQIIGGSFGRGSLVAAYDYANDEGMDVVDTGFFLSPLPSGRELRRMDLIPQAERHSVLLSGAMNLSDGVELTADGLYTKRDSSTQQRDIRPGESMEGHSNINSDSEQYSAALGANVDLPRAWKLRINASTSGVVEDNVVEQFIPAYSFTSRSQLASKSTLSGISAVADGALGSFGWFEPRMAIGVETREEGLLFHERLSGTVYNDTDRKVHSAFAELSLPLLGTQGAQHLDLSIAGRYDDYSDFGDTFNPQFGLAWSPVAGVSLRTAYSSAYRAPALRELSNGGNPAYVLNRADPLTGGMSPVLFSIGAAANLQPEKADTWSFGVDYEPAFLPDTRISVSYFDIDYRNRIDIPAVGTDFELVLQREARFAGLVDRNVTLEDIEAIRQLTSNGAILNGTPRPYDPATGSAGVLAAFPDLVIFDNRSNNISTETARGLDLAVSSRFQAGTSSIDVGLNSTYTISHKRSVTASSPAFTRINEAGKPVGLRMRLNAGWSRGALAAYVYANYVDGYVDPFQIPAGHIGSWTTFDMVLRLDGSQLGSAGMLDGVNVTLSIDNLFDRDPPRFIGQTSGLAYDATNAGPMGRYVSLRVSKRWNGL